MENKKIDTMPTEISVVEEPQINIFGEIEPDVLEKSVWDKSVKVEENGYYWKRPRFYQRWRNSK